MNKNSILKDVIINNTEQGKEDKKIEFNTYDEAEKVLEELKRYTPMADFKIEEI
ncbi:hypothetical protein ACQCWI_15905 [Bacillus thuringiensis]|uniref:hypothetical protein n=1 Tax=Bacillus thuringiensis TaxID=1428 RepID=UPI003CE88277